MYTIAVEGSSFSGKSTLCSVLGDYFNAPVIGEFFDYAPSLFPPFAETSAELDQQIDYYIDLEKARAVDHAARRTEEIVIVDRTAASLIAFQQTMQEHPAGATHCWSSEAMLHQLKGAMAIGNVIMPQAVVLISAGSESAHRARVATRGEVAISAINDWNFSETIRANTRESVRNLFGEIILEELVTDTIEKRMIDSVTKRIMR